MISLKARARASSFSYSRLPCGCNRFEIRFADFCSGPPGVGKTLTAEAISEYQRRPLYRVGNPVQSLQSMRSTNLPRSVLETSASTPTSSSVA